MNKRAQGLSINTIIITILAMLVLVVLGSIITGRIVVFSGNPTEFTVTEVVGSDALELRVLDVGQGQAILVKFPNNQSMLYDGGTGLKKWQTDYAGWNLEYIIGSNPDKDHIGNLADVINRAEHVRYVADPDTNCDTNTCAIFRNAYGSRKASRVELDERDSWNMGAVKVQVLNPPMERFGDDNEDSIVLLLRYGNASVLLMGDCESKCEARLIESKVVRDVTVLQVGHHGSKTSTGPLFSAMMNPEIAVISVGKNNQYGHPSQTVIDRLNSDGATVYRTDNNGSILMQVWPDGSVNTYPQRSATND